MLRQFGYASLLFPSAEAFTIQSDFDSAVCFLLDINLGDGSGIELRLGLKAAGKLVPVIYMTGNDSPTGFVWPPINPGVSPISRSRSPHRS